MKNRVGNSKVNTSEQDFHLPVHSLEGNSLHINILPLDHRNPYDFKREHRHTYFELMFIEKSGGHQLIDFNNYPVQENSCYIIFPQQVHLMERQNSQGTIIQFTEEQINMPQLKTALMHHSFQANAAIVFEQRSDLLDEIKPLLHLLKQKMVLAEEGGSMTISLLLQSIVALVLANSTRSESIAIQEDKTLLIGFYQLLEEHFGSNLGVANYVQLLGTTDKKLSAASKKYAGYSPLQVIHNRILLEAKRLLLFENLSHKEIAFQLGFDSPASFSTFVKSKTGLAPSGLSKHLAEIHK